MEDAKSPQEVMEDAECQTCKNRKYQDGSDDPGVSFKTATNVAPELAASAVRGHEQEHVVRERSSTPAYRRRFIHRRHRSGLSPGHWTDRLSARSSVLIGGPVLKGAGKEEILQTLGGVEGVLTVVEA